MSTAPNDRIAYLVFAQRADANLDVDAWTVQAARFFATKLGAMAPHPRPDVVREDDSVDVVLLHGDDDARGQVRRVSSRVTAAGDLAVAERAESKHPGGLLHLARRCGHVYEVATNRDPDHGFAPGRDVIALRLAAILASVVLGPIVDPARVEIFGVKTARAMLER